MRSRSPSGSVRAAPITTTPAVSSGNTAANRRATMPPNPTPTSARTRLSPRPRISAETARARSSVDSSGKAGPSICPVKGSSVMGEVVPNGLPSRLAEMMCRLEGSSGRFSPISSRPHPEGWYAEPSRGVSARWDQARSCSNTTEFSPDGSP
jgi:hypothetical protein